MKKKLEMKNDGHDHERFRDLLKTVVTVSKDEIKKHEKDEKRKKATKKDEYLKTRAD